MVGLGLGVWRISAQQNMIYADTFLEALVDLRPEHVSDLELAWILTDSAEVE